MFGRFLISKNQADTGLWHRYCFSASLLECPDFKFLRCELIFVFMRRLLFSMVMLGLPVIADVAAADALGKGKLIRELNGREVYVQSCAMCHANGVGGAPRPGRPEDWGERSRNGPAALMVSVLRGKGAMPPKGGNASLTAAEAYVALDFMLNGSK